MEHARIAGLWEWKRLWSHINKKRPTILFHCSRIFYSPSERHSCSTVSGQYRCCKLSESCREGTRSRTLSDLAIANWEWYSQRKIYILAIHVPGILNKTSDGLSCQKLESAESMLDPNVFCETVAVFQQPQVDLLASHQNHRLPNYFSWIPDPRTQAMGTYAFSIPWQFKLCYLFPPFPLVQKCIQKSKIKQDKTDALLITPVWKSRPWYPL